MSVMTGIQQAFNQQIGKELYEYQRTRSGFIAMLAAIDNFWGVQSRITRSSDTSGKGGQIEIRTGLPSVEGVKALTGSLQSLEMRTPQQGFSTIAVDFPWSHYQLREDVRTQLLKTYENGKVPKTLAQHIANVSKACADALLNKLAEHIFPVANLAPSNATGPTNGYMDEDKVMALAYPLQSGFATNAATGTGSYTYFGLDLNSDQYSPIKALNYGTTGSGAVATSSGATSAYRRNVRIPLSHRGATPDMIVTDTKFYDRILSAGESALLITDIKNFDYGGEKCKFMGMYMYPEYRLDLLDAGSLYREQYTLTSSEWEFRIDPNLQNLEVKDNPNTLALKTLLGLWRCGLVCKWPRVQARSYNLQDT